MDVSTAVSILLLVVFRFLNEGRCVPLERQEQVEDITSKDVYKEIPIYIEARTDSYLPDSGISGDIELTDIYLPVHLEENIFTDGDGYVGDDWRAGYESKHFKDSSSSIAHCDTPLGLAVDADTRHVDAIITTTEGIADNVRLNSPIAWAVDSLGDNTFIQISLNRQMYISGLKTQGSPTSEDRVTHYKVLYSEDCQQYKNARIDERDFATNIDPNRTTVNMFHNILVVRCMRIIPTDRVRGKKTALRLELLGCDHKSCSTPLISVEELELSLHGYSTRKVLFNSEKVITQVTIEIQTDNIIGTPSFFLANSRTCSYFDYFTDGNTLQPKEFVPEPGSREIVVEGEPWFPRRAQCLLAFVSDSHGLSPAQFQLSYKGCDAVDTEGVLHGCGKSREDKRKRKRKKRVVGGFPSRPGEWPWLVSLHFLGNMSFTEASGLPHLCGGSLIRQDWVLTAAHCVDTLLGPGLDNASQWLVVAGEHAQGIDDGTEQVLEVERIIQHPQFHLSENAPIVNDIALMKLKEPAVLSDYVNVVCWQEQQHYLDKTCVTAGWGQSKQDGTGVELPNYAVIPVLDPEVCKSRYSLLPDNHEAKITVSFTDSIFCAATENNGTDACWGDSGGPFFCYDDGRWIQVGIVSLGYECGNVAIPAVYTLVPYFQDWISSVVDEEQ